MDNLQKEALIRSVQQIINENGDDVTDCDLDFSTDTLPPDLTSKSVIWVNAWTKKDLDRNFAITGWRYLKNLNEVIAEQREERMKELGI